MMLDVLFGFPFIVIIFFLVMSEFISFIYHLMIFMMYLFNTYFHCKNMDTKTVNQQKRDKYNTMY
jgi:ABC-type nitrate/sulfonate/bicarbonate transport system permease component